VFLIDVIPSHSYEFWDIDFPHSIRRGALNVKQEGKGQFCYFSSLRTGHESIFEVARIMKRRRRIKKGKEDDEKKDEKKI
jgi:hypothetical protein